MLKKQWLMILSVGLLCWQTQAQAEDLAQSLIECQQYQQERAQLTCFNELADRVNSTHRVKVAQLSDDAVVKPALRLAKKQTFLERKWHLNKGAVNDNLTWGPLETHRENYLVASMSSNPNDVTASPNQASSSNRDLQNKDAHFQISLKTEFVPDFSDFLKQHVPMNLAWLDSARVWAAYTQRSYWQVLDGGDSRPFRETNFAPELILSLGFNNARAPWMPKMINLAGIHESNGRSDPFSRSWNRIYIEGGWELGDAYTLIARPWWHIPEGSGSDNPDINRYLGYGDLTLRWDPKDSKHAASLLLRNNLRSDNKGYAKLGYYYGFKPNLNFYAMLSTGYGESLLDYNHAQNLIGFGIAVTE